MSIFNAYKQAAAARVPLQQSSREIHGRLRLCWACQKEKPLKEGHLSNVNKNGGSGLLQRFVCFECKDKVSKGETKC